MARVIRGESPLAQRPERSPQGPPMGPPPPKSRLPLNSHLKEGLLLAGALVFAYALTETTPTVVLNHSPEAPGAWNGHTKVAVYSTEGPAYKSVNDASVVRHIHDEGVELLQRALPGTGLSKTVDIHAPVVTAKDSHAAVIDIMELRPGVVTVQLLGPEGLPNAAGKVCPTYLDKVTLNPSSSNAVRTLRKHLQTFYAFLNP